MLTVIPRTAATRHSLLALLIGGALLVLPSFTFADTYGSGVYGGSTYAGNPPTVTTGSTTSLGQTSATLGGTITDIGSTSPSVRGFAYGTSASYGATTTDSAGPFSTGAFSTTLSSLTCNTGYHFRAYATSTNGIGYGSDTTFTTSACSVSSNSSTGGSMVVGSGPFAPGFVYVNTPSFSVPIPRTISSGTFIRDLEAGNSGEDVRALQIFLNTNGFVVANTGAGSPGSETSLFGNATKAALIKFQIAKGITPAIGYFGPKTKAAMQGSVSSQPTTQPGSATTASFTQDLEIGSTGEDVLALQKYLNAHGFLVATSGAGSPGNETLRFGAATKAALIKFQVARNITPAIGYFGPKTRAAIAQ